MNTNGFKKLLILLLTIALLSQTPPGDPLEIPELNAPQFQSSQINPIIDQADQARTQSGWESLVLENLTAYTAAWEAGLQNQIDLELLAVNTADHFHTEDEYRDFIQKAMALELRSAANDWSLDADRDIEIYRERFITALTDEQARRAAEKSDRTLDQAGAEKAYTRKGYEEDRRVWENEYQAALADGQYEFAVAIGAVDRNYQSFMATMAAKEEEFETNRQAIVAYEKTVRDGIAARVVEMDAYLGSSDQFYQETCTTVGSGSKTTQNCATDPNTLNAAGQDLANLITALTQGLNNNDPLAALALTMNQYLEAQKLQAENTETYWAGLVNGTDSYNPQNVAGQGWNSPNDPLIAAVIAARNGDQAALIAFAQGLDPRQVLGITNADIQGKSYWYPGTAGHSGAGEYYSQAGAYAFTFAYSENHTTMVPQGVCWGWPVSICTTMWIPYNWQTHHEGNEQELAVTSSYNWYDANADANRATWNGYVDDLDPVVAHWTNNLLPAIHNWEKQAADYAQAHTQFQADATVQKQEALQLRDDAMNAIVRRRNIWEAQMHEEIRHGEMRWEAVAADGTVTAPAGPNMPRLKPEIDPTGEALAALRALDLKTASVSQAGDASRPDFSVMESVYNSFQATTRGLLNLTLAESLSDAARAESQKMIEQTAASLARSSLDGLSEEQLLAMARQSAEKTGRPVEEVLAQIKADAAGAQYKVEVLSNGTVRATREIASGKAIRTGGDGTGYDDYTAEKITQELKIAPPPALKLASAGELFAAWDHNQVLGQAENNQISHSAALNKYYTKMSGDMEQADRARDENDRMFQADMQSQMTAARESAKGKGMLDSFLESLGGAMMGGATMDKAFKSTMESQSKNYLSEAVARATGMPVGFVGGVVGGLKPHEAAYKNLEAEAYRSFEETVGIDGAAVYLGEYIKERETNRQAHEAARGPAALNVVNQMRYHETGRAVLEGSIGLASGRIISEATGLPAALPLMAVPGLGSAAAIAMSTMPSTLAEAEAMTADLEKVRTGKMTGKEVGSDYQAQAKVKLEAQFEQSRNIQKLNSTSVFTGFTNILSGVATPAMNVVNSLLVPGKEASGTENALRGIVAGSLKKATGYQDAFIDGLVVHGEDIGTATTRGIYENLLEQHNLLEVERKLAERGLPGFEARLRERVAEWEKQKEAMRAAQPRPEDAILGIPYLWRNAQHDTTAAAVVSAAELGAAVAIAMSSGGVAAPVLYAYLAYMGTKGAYQGSMEGGTIGAIAGAGSALGNAFLGQYVPGMNASLTYSHENGFGATLGAGLAIGAGGAGTLGGYAQFQQGEGMVGYGLNAGVRGAVGDDTVGTEAGGVFSLNYDRSGQFLGGGLKGTAGSNEDVTGSLGYNFDRTGSYSGFSVESSIAQRGEGPVDMFGKEFSPSFQTGLGATFHSTGHTDLTVSQSLGLVRQGMGVSGINTTVAGTIQLDQRGRYKNTLSAVSVGLQMRSQAQAIQDMAREQLRLNNKLAQAEDPAERARVLDEIRNLATIMRQTDPTGAITDYEKNLAAKLDPEDPRAVAIREKHAQGLTLSDKERHDLALALNAGGVETRETLLAQVSGAFGDAWDWLNGTTSSAAGYVDSNGDWVQATCFPAGTIVRVHPRTEGAFDAEGRYFKAIEKIRIDELVLSFSEQTGKTEFRPVKKLHVNETRVLFKIGLQGKQFLQATWNHPFFTEGKWVVAKDLKPGAIIQGAGPGMGKLPGLQLSSLAGSDMESGLVVTSVEEIILTQTIRVFNFEVDENQTYFVGRGGALVHNYQVEKGDSLSAEIVARMGRFTPELMRATLELNPHLKDRGCTIKSCLIKTGEILILPGEEKNLVAQKLATIKELAAVRKELSEQAQVMNAICESEPNTEACDIETNSFNAAYKKAESLVEIGKSLQAESRQIALEKETRKQQDESWSCRFLSVGCYSGSLKGQVEKVAIAIKGALPKNQPEKKEQVAAQTSSQGDHDPWWCVWCGGDKNPSPTTDPEISELMTKKTLNQSEKLKVIGYIFKDKQVEPELILALIKTETGTGLAFDNQGRPIIRFEAHRFDPSRNHADRLTYGGCKTAGADGKCTVYYPPWQNQKFKEANGTWISYHAGDMATDKNDQEHRVVQWAATINKEKAYREMSMGAPQIMGSDHAKMGFASAEQMYQAFQQSEGAQYQALYRWIQEAKGAALWTALRNKNYSGIACRYNGCGTSASSLAQRANYAQKLEAKYNAIPK